MMPLNKVDNNEQPLSEQPAQTIVNERIGDPGEEENTDHMEQEP